MNIRMESTSGIPKTWDFEVDEDGNAKFITGDDAELQTSQIAAFSFKGSTRQISSDIYPDWLGWMTGAISFGELDVGIQQSIEGAGITDHFPDYALKNNKLEVIIKKILTYEFFI